MMKRIKFDQWVHGWKSLWDFWEVRYTGWKFGRTIITIVRLKPLNYYERPVQLDLTPEDLEQAHVEIGRRLERDLGPTKDALERLLEQQRMTRERLPDEQARVDAGVLARMTQEATTYRCAWCRQPVGANRPGAVVSTRDDKRWCNARCHERWLDEGWPL